MPRQDRGLDDRDLVKARVHDDIPRVLAVASESGTVHRSRLNPQVVDRITRRRGQEPYVFDPMDPARTAHVVVDLQNGFLEANAPVEVPTAREIVPRVNSISEAVYRAGGINVFLRFTTAVNDMDMYGWPAFYRRQPESFRKAHAAAFAPGAHYWQLWPHLRVRENDMIVDKTRFDAFVPGTCDLHQLLQERGVDRLIISGGVTNCCCESTARTAMQLNYGVIFVSDSTAAHTDAEHNATLTTMWALFADVKTTDEVVTALLPR